MSDIAHILQQLESGDLSAAEQMLPLVLEELQGLATVGLASESGQNLRPSDLIYDAYVKLVPSEMQTSAQCRKHFFNAAVNAMWQILIDQGYGERQRPSMALDDAKIDRLESSNQLAATIAKYLSFEEPGGSYEDIEESAKPRIPAGNVEWTEYEESDPGVTLVQLFDFFTEQILYRRNLIPVQCKQKLLSLIRIAIEENSETRQQS
jgi:hypothetical protein